ncbi:beta-propeller domain-containing protein [Patescibacteria group bacterium]|nr:beta-propeller domain-containing protein [Patescibacteria group bacterium]
MKKLIPLSLFLALFVAQTANAAFSDLYSDDPAYDAIKYLEEVGTVQGYSDGTFKSKNKINRAEFVKIVVETLTDNPTGENCFPDVKNEWYAPYICYAKTAGLVNGYPDGTFKPGQEINFAEASKIIANMEDLKLPSASFGDPWYKKYVEPIADLSAIPTSITGMDKTIARGEMSEIIWRLEENITDLDSLKYEELEGELAPISSCAELKDLFLNQNNNIYYTIEEAAPTATADDDDLGASDDTSGDSAKSAENSEATEFSETNVQVAGVDESDIVKTDGKYIYVVDGQEVHIISAQNGLSLAKNLTFDSDFFYPDEIYVDGDRLVVLGSDQNYSVYPLLETEFFPYYHENRTSAYIYNIEDPSNPDLMRHIELDGSLSTSRKVDDTLYLALNKWDFYYYVDEPETVNEDEILPRLYDSAKGEEEPMVSCTDIRYIPRERDLNYLITVAIPLRTDDSAIDREVIIGSSENLYASTNNIYIASTNYDSYDYYYDYSNAKTLIHRFALEPGKITYEKSGKVPGTILNQFSMDENNDYFRIATTKGEVWSSVMPSTNNLYILNQEMDIVGSIEDLAPGETIYSTRFIGNRGYMVTFKKIDPLFVFDLTDPYNPRLLGELKIPGFSDYLHPYDEDHLLGFGKDAADPLEEEAAARDIDFAWYQGMKVALFDVSDPSNPSQMFSTGIGDRGTESELLWNHKALLFSKNKELLAFPVTVAEVTDPIYGPSTYGDYVFQGAYVYNLNLTDGFRLGATLTHYEDFPEDYWYWYDTEKTIQRILYIGDTLFTVSPGEVRSYDLDSFGELNRLTLNQS